MIAQATATPAAEDRRARSAAFDALIRRVDAGTGPDRTLDTDIECLLRSDNARRPTPIEWNALPRSTFHDGLVMTETSRWVEACAWTSSIDAVCRFVAERWPVARWQVRVSAGRRTSSFVVLMAGYTVAARVARRDADEARARLGALLVLARFHIDPDSAEPRP